MERVRAERSGANSKREQGEIMPLVNAQRAAWLNPTRRCLPADQLRAVSPSIRVEAETGAENLNRNLKRHHRQEKKYRNFFRVLTASSPVGTPPPTAAGSDSSSSSTLRSRGSLAPAYRAEIGSVPRRPLTWKRPRSSFVPPRAMRWAGAEAYFRKIV